MRKLFRITKDINTVSLYVFPVCVGAFFNSYVSGWVALYRGTNGIHFRVGRYCVAIKMPETNYIKWALVWPKNTILEL